MSTRLTSTQFVGRESQLAQVELAYREAREGRPSLILISGDSGVGKTRLIQEAERTFDDALTLRGECLEQGESELPYAPLLGALRGLVRERHPALAELSSGVRANLSTLLPSLAEPDGGGVSGGGSVSGGGDRQPGDGQLRMFESLLELLHLLSRHGTIVLALEDLHWADSSTRTFVSFLARSLSHERLMVLLTYRSDELHRRHPLRPLLAELGRVDGVQRIELEPFDRGELTTALTDILGRPPEDDLIDRLLERTDGNPLYVEELLAAALDGRGAAPQSLRDAFMLRTDRLGDSAGRILRTVAVGRSLDEAMIGAITNLPEQELRDGLREAVAEHMLITTDEGHFRLRHALLREAVYDDLLPGERSSLHVALARAHERSGPGCCLEDDLARVAAVATHYAAAGERTEALRAAISAGHSARRVNAHPEAAELGERALELWSQVTDPETVAGIDHVELLEFTAVAHGIAGELRRSEMLAELALEELDRDRDPVRYGRLLGRRARTRWRLNRAGEALADAQLALELLPPESSPERAQLLSWVARTQSLRGHYREAVGDGEQALAVAEAAGMPGVAGEVLNTLGMARIALGEVDSGERLLREAIRLAREQEDLDDLGTAYSNLADLLHLAGRTPDALMVIEEGLREVRSYLGRTHSWMELTLSVLAFESGDWKLAFASEGLPVTALAGVPLMFKLLRDAELAMGQGQDELAAERLVAAEPLVRVTREAQWHGLYGSLCAELRRRGGDLDGAQAAVAQGIDELEVCTDDVMRIARLTAAGLTVEADRARRARDLREPEVEDDAIARLRIHLDRLEAAASEGGPVEAAWLATGQAEAARGRGSNDAALWAAAAEAWDALGRPYGAALTRWRQAEALVEDDDRTAAAEVATRSLAAAERLGADWLRGELHGLIARGRLEVGTNGGPVPTTGTIGSPTPEPAAGQPAGGPPPAAAASADAAANPFGLTARELQVLALIAEGATNRQIGNALYMAEKTASVHVSRILSKLDVKSRTQAAAVAHRLHLA